MTETAKLSIDAYTDGDVDTNRSNNPTLESLVASRRQTLFGGISAITAAAFGALPLAACSDGDDQDNPPTVSVGGAITTSAGRAVTLSGTATDDKGVTESGWTQIGGAPTVTLTRASATEASFIAPAVAAPVTLTFEFAARDSRGVPAVGVTTVTVQPAQLSFTAVPRSLADIVTVPAGYRVTVLYRTGDPLTAQTPAYANNGTDTGYATRAGDHHDGIYYYGLAATGSARNDANSTRGLLVMNHENINQQYLHVGVATPSPRPESEAIKEIECHGVSVLEVVRAGDNGAWSYVQNSPLNRRVTPNTPTAFTGPARGHAQLRTPHSPTGVAGRGTVNNCAIGYTPWGTYITCEENWAGYFRRGADDNAARTAKEVAALNRYGVSQGASGSFGWATVNPANGADTSYARWNASASGASALADFRNEPNQFGWIVEIDPYDPASTPRKRTALARMGHEGCWPSKFVVGRKPAFYMGDDSRDEYLYKFVSAAAWQAADATAADRMAIGDKYLDAGTLYVARFDANGTGAWLPLVFGTGPITAANPAYAFADQADVLINARLAADALGATKMDRPEWTATNEQTGEIYLTLTNTNASFRPIGETDAANPRFYNDPKGGAAQTGNPNGHIIRIREAGDNSESLTFSWDIYLFGAGADLDPANINLSALDATNDFSSPDGLWFGRASNPSGVIKPLLWIQTDDGAYTDVTNNQMLAALPGVTGDGGVRTITNTSGGANAQQQTRVGAAPGVNLKRFLVGPKEAEITGVDSTPDGRTLFVNIQHPGELGTAAAPTSNWPANQGAAAPATTRPRSATIVITKDDGGVVGL